MCEALFQALRMSRDQKKIIYEISQCRDKKQDKQVDKLAIKELNTANQVNKSVIVMACIEEC